MSLLFTLPVWGQAIRFEQNVLFVKLKSEQAFHHPLIQHQKQLFDRVYEVGTRDAILLENDLLQNDEVEWVEKSFISNRKQHERLNENVNKNATSSSFGLNDPMSSELWGFRPASAKGISIQEAYANMPSWQPTPVIVAVVDTGVDYRHSDLRDNMWVNTREIPGNRIDDDNNGHVDDIYGIDVLHGDSDPMPTHFHGTHVAGTIAAVRNNNQGVAGVASHAKIMALRTIPDDTDETDRDVINSFLYAARNGARIINCSFGKRRQARTVSETMAHIGRENNVLVVAASGNDSDGANNQWYNIDRRPHYPSAFNTETMLVVTATGLYGDLADFANIGVRNVDVAAPGDHIFSTIIGNRYGDSSGTSMATPMVSGIAAQLLAYYPSLTPLEIKDIIIKSVVKTDSLKSKVLSGGRADLARAMEYAAVNYSHRH